MSTSKQSYSGHHHTDLRLTIIPLVSLTTVVLLFATAFWTTILPLRFSKPSVKAASPLTGHINIPYFSGAVPFNQTAIFWFGDVTSTDNYTDVRIELHPKSSATPEMIEKINQLLQQVSEELKLQ